MSHASNPEADAAPSMPTRRRMLQLVGGGVVIAAAGGWVATREPAAALRPWRDAGRVPGDARHRALSWALLAPSPHNRQPWLVALEGADRIVIHCDLARRLPHTDPQDRQITISLGGFVELLVQAAAADGHACEVDWFPEGEPEPRLDGRPVVRVRLVADRGISVGPLFEHAAARRSNKEPYDTGRAVSPSVLRELAAMPLASVVEGSVDPGKVSTLRQASWDALRCELETDRTLRESVDLLRIGRNEIERSPDGIDLAGPMIEAMSMLGLMDRQALLDRGSSAYAQQLDHLRRPIDSAMGHLWMHTPGNRRIDQVGAGRDWLRVHLRATALGVDLHPLSQALQEFPEMAPHRVALRETLGVAPNRHLQMFARIGYGPKVPPSPRWPLQERIVA